MVGKEDGKKEGSLVISGRCFVLHFSFAFLTSFVGFIFRPYWMPAIGRWYLSYYFLSFISVGSVDLI